MIHQGDVYWIDLGQPIGSEPAYIHPYVVIQNNLLNRSQIRTVIVCALTTNLRRARALGKFSKFWQVWHWSQNRSLSTNAIWLAYDLSAEKIEGQY